MRGAIGVGRVFLLAVLALLVERLNVIRSEDSFSASVSENDNGADQLEFQHDDSDDDEPHRAHRVKRFFGRPRFRFGRRISNAWANRPRWRNFRRPSLPRFRRRKWKSAAGTGASKQGFWKRLKNRFRKRKNKQAGQDLWVGGQKPKKKGFFSKLRSKKQRDQGDTPKKRRFFSKRRDSKKRRKQETSTESEPGQVKTAEPDGTQTYAGSQFAQRRYNSQGQSRNSQPLTDLEGLSTHRQLEDGRSTFPGQRPPHPTRPAPPPPPPPSPIQTRRSHQPPQSHFDPQELRRLLNNPHLRDEWRARNGIQSPPLHNLYAGARKRRSVQDDTSLASQSAHTAQNNRIFTGQIKEEVQPVQHGVKPAGEELTDNILSGQIPAA